MDKILDLIYPPVCGICGKLDKNSLCKACENMLKKYFDIKIEEYKNEKYYDKHIYFFMYEGIIRKLILNYKFNDKAYLYKTFVNFLIKQKKVFEIIKSYDIILPVPISKKRYNQRGYNQAELICRQLSKEVKIKIVKKCLYKQKDIVPQSSLNKESRIQNVKDAYKIKNIRIIKNKKIILFDDIYTTGSTANECSKILKKNGAKEVIVITLAKD